MKDMKKLFKVVLFALFPIIFIVFGFDRAIRGLGLLNGHDVGLTVGQGIAVFMIVYAMVFFMAVRFLSEKK